VASEAPAFFSYCRDDSDFALRLAEDLKAERANVWIDQIDIEPGARWDRAVEDALNNCPRMLVIMSPASVRSENVRDEISFALRKQKVIIPVLYRDCDVPLRLERHQHIDFRTNYERGLKALQKALGAGRTSIAEPTSLNGQESRAVYEGQQGVERARLDEERKQAAEQARLDEERKQAAEQARLDEERKRTAEQARLDEERKRTAEQARLDEERKQAAEQARLEQQERDSQSAVEKPLLEEGTIQATAARVRSRQKGSGQWQKWQFVSSTRYRRLWIVL
jgi:hypothetical protein